MTRMRPHALLAALVAATSLAATAALTGGSRAAADGDAAQVEPSGVQVPDGYKRIVDDTGTISVAVPQSWAVETTPRPFEGFPEISAGPGRTPALCSECSQGWQLPVLRFFATPYEEVTTPGEDCHGGDVVAYDDGRFVGYRINNTGCDAVVDEVVAGHVDGALTAHLSFVYASVDAEPVLDRAEAEQVFDVILRTFDWTGTPYPDLPDQPPPASPVIPQWPYDEFHDVPQLGSEPVRGSGCGSQGQIGDTIPDGVWAGFATVNGGAVKIDVLCIFYGESAEAVRSEGSANIINDEPDYLVVNNSERVRVAPTAMGIELRDSVIMAPGECVAADDVYSDHSGNSPDPERQAWIHIHNGEVKWIVWGCSAFGDAAPSGNLPAALPDPNTAEGSVWPYGEFWNVPQLGTEPVRGSGCGGEGQIGDTIPDGLWAGYVAYDPDDDSFWIDLLCIYFGESAQAVLAEGTANVVSNEPDYLIVNNSDQRRQAPNNLRVVAGSWLNEEGRCVEGGRAWAASNEGHLTPEGLMYDTQAWIRVHDGAVTWILWGCDTGWTPGG